MSLKRVAPENLVGRCSWCGRTIPATMSIVAIGGKSREGEDLSAQAGQWIQVELDSQRRLAALVPAANSQAAAQGFNVMFIACSEQCGKDMKIALAKAINQGESSLTGVDTLGA